MLKWMLAAGAAALAITAPALAEKGGQGGGSKGQSGQVAKAQKGGGGGGHANRGQSGSHKMQSAQGGGGGGHANRGQGGGGHKMQSAQSGHAKQKGSGGGGHANRGHSGGSHKMQSAQRGEARQKGGGQAKFKAQDHGNNRIANVNRADNGKFNRANSDVIRGKGGARFATVDGDNIVRVRDVDRRGVVRVRDIDRDDLFVRRLGYGVGGCPPGLAKKPVACMPPGQAAKWVGQPLVAATRFGALGPLPRSFNNLYWDNDDYYYRYGGGYLYRVDRDDALIASMIPLFGAALIGQPLQPNYVNSYYTPPYFNAFYPNSPYDCYRYGYSYVYETSCATGLVTDVIPTYGYGYGVGQLLPASYGYYNLPYQYRSYYTDNDDYYYRYAPGAIYRVDRDTALISAVVSLLAGGLTVGQPLPVGYSAYNVPLAYRTTYYDTPDVMYRYNNGYIYAVDPGTRMVNSVAYAIV